MQMDAGTSVAHDRLFKQEILCSKVCPVLGMEASHPLCFCLTVHFVCRWMGNLRFTVGAVQQIMQGKTHHARIAVLPCDHAEAAIQQSRTTSGMTPLPRPLMFPPCPALAVCGHQVSQGLL